MMEHRTAQICVSPATYETAHCDAGQGKARVVRAHFHGCTAVIEDQERESYTCY